MANRIRTNAASLEAERLQLRQALDRVFAEELGLPCSRGVSPSPDDWQWRPVNYLGGQASANGKVQVLAPTQIADRLDVRAYLPQKLSSIIAASRNGVWQRLADICEVSRISETPLIGSPYVAIDEMPLVLAQV
jgi:hypothetical protein